MKQPTTAMVLGVSLLVLAIIGGAPGSAPDRVAAQSSVPGEVLVRFKETPANSGVRLLTSRLTLFAAAEEIHYDRRTDLWRIRFGDDEIASASNRLAADAGVSHTQPNYVYGRASGPNDAFYSGAQRPYLAAINLPAAWEQSVGEAEVVVAVIDSGVDIDHPDLESNIWDNAADPTDGIDNDGNGCVDDTHGCSFQSDPADGNVADLDGHGTFISGIIAARRDNEIGVAGVAPNAIVMPVRALNELGKGTTAQLVSAIEYAAQNGADIINLSLALDPDNPVCEPDVEMTDALAALDEDYGTTVLAATGNSALSCVKLPAASEHVIAVSASGPPERPDIHAQFANYGPEVDITAPGMGLVSTCPVPTAVPVPNYCPGTEYGSSAGTSFSTPIAAAVAALLLGQNPNLTNDEVRSRLMATAHDLPDDQHANWDGAGRVDAARALGVTPIYASIDIAVPGRNNISVEVVAAGGSGADACRVSLWEAPVKSPEVAYHVFHRPSVSGTFGVAQCGDDWPPQPGQPWRLVVTNRGDKAVTLNAWAVRSGDLACGAADVPVTVPGDQAVSSEIACAGNADNDTIGGATEIDTSQIPLRFQRDLRLATSEGDPLPSCLPTAGTGVKFSRSVWYRLKPSGPPMEIAVDAFGSEMDAPVSDQKQKTVLAVYRQGASGLEEVACNVRFSPEGRIESRVVWRTDGTSTYFVMGAAYQGVPMGVLRVNFSPADIPGNDAVEGAPLISLSDAYSVVQPAHSAARDASDPTVSCAAAYRFSLWFRLVEPAGQALTLTTAGSDYNTVVGVFKRDAGGAFTEVACSDNEAPGVVTSRASWQSDGGEYFVVIGSFIGFSGGVLRADLQSP